MVHAAETPEGMPTQSVRVSEDHCVKFKFLRKQKPNSGKVTPYIWEQVNGDSLLIKEEGTLSSRTLYSFTQDRQTNNRNGTIMGQASYYVGPGPYN